MHGEPCPLLLLNGGLWLLPIKFILTVFFVCSVCVFAECASEIHFTEVLNIGFYTFTQQYSWLWHKEGIYFFLTWIISRSSTTG